MGNVEVQASLEPAIEESKIEAEDTLQLIKAALKSKKKKAAKKTKKPKEAPNTLVRFFNDYGESPHLGGARERHPPEGNQKVPNSPRTQNSAALVARQVSLDPTFLRRPNIKLGKTPPTKNAGESGKSGGYPPATTKHEATKRAKTVY